MSISAIEIGMITTFVPSSVRSPMCQIGVGIVPAGNATDVAPSTQSHEVRVPGRPCSTAATMIRPRPIVEIRAAIGGAWRRRNGRRHTCSITRPISAEIAMPSTAATQNDWPWLMASE